MPDFVRVRLDGVGEWSNPIGHPIPEGAVILDEPAVDGTGQVREQVPFSVVAPVERVPFFATPPVGDDVPTVTVPEPDPDPLGDAPAGRAKSTRKEN